MRLSLVLSLIVSLFAWSHSHGQIITTVVGNATTSGSGGFAGDEGPATAARLNDPGRIKADKIGNLYIADIGNKRVRKVDTAGIITTVAGDGSSISNGEAVPATAIGGSPSCVAVDDAGNLYIGGYGTLKSFVRKVDTAGIITTIAGNNNINVYSGDGGPARDAGFFSIVDIDLDKYGNIYVVEDSSRRIRKIDTNGIITTIAGNGVLGISGSGIPATAAHLDWPRGLFVDTLNNIYISDRAKIKKIDAAGIIYTIAGNDTATQNGDGGPATNASISYPQGLVVDTVGNVYVGSTYRSIVRKIDPNGIITTIAGTFGAGSGLSGDGGPATAALLGWPCGLTLDKAGNLYILDQYFFIVRKITGLPMIPVPIITQSNQPVLPGHITLQIFPNPNSGIFTLHLSSPQKENATLIITNVFGEKVKELTAFTNIETQIQLNAPPGMYFLTATTANGKQTTKIVVQ